MYEHQRYHHIDSGRINRNFQSRGYVEKKIFNKKASDIAVGKQKVIFGTNVFFDIWQWILNKHVKKVLLVSSGSIQRQMSFFDFCVALNAKGIEIIYFRDFRPNPLYESIVKGVKTFNEEHCNAIVAVGGGSAIDVAKCIKVFCNMVGDGADGSYLRQKIIPNQIPFLAMPTTAGTGSEATHYAVIYYDGYKQSIAHESCIPDTVLMDSTVLKSLPLYQRKATMLDAFCHAIESFWSVNSTEESKKFSRQAIEMVLAHMNGYLTNTDEGNAGMLLAAHIAGKAIDITQTTAGHAMCYKITSLFGISHGHAAALCNRKLFVWMVHNIDLCIDRRGERYLNNTFVEIAHAMRCGTAIQAARKFENIFEKLELEVPDATGEQFEILSSSVNPVRLKNHPVRLARENIDQLYHEILGEAENEC